MIDWNKHDNATCVSVTYFDSNGDAISTSWADRPAQTKTVADALGQEGEKWTHTLWGDKAYIKIAEPDCDGYLMAVTESNGYHLVKMEDLKPIKPTMTKDEQEMVAKFIARVWSKSNPDLRAEFDSFCKEHDII